MTSSTKQAIYLTLAFLGIVGTWYFNLQIETATLTSFFIRAFDTPLSSSLMVDLFVAVATFFVWMIPEARRLNMPAWLIGLLILLTFAIAFAFSFPLFLFFRERAMNSQSP